MKPIKHYLLHQNSSQLWNKCHLLPSILYCLLIGVIRLRLLREQIENCLNIWLLKEVPTSTSFILFIIFIRKVYLLYDNPVASEFFFSFSLYVFSEFFLFSFSYIWPSLSLNSYPVAFLFLFWRRRVSATSLQMTNFQHAQASTWGNTNF